MIRKILTKHVQYAACRKDGNFLFLHVHDGGRSAGWARMLSCLPN